jgi:hypothetical protein
MCLSSFSNLLADGHYWIECGHRFLKDDGDLSPADLAPFISPLLKQIVVAPENFTAYICSGSEQTEDGKGCCAFARPRLTDQAEHFSFVDAEADAAYRLRSAEPDTKIANLEEGAHAAIVEHRERWTRRESAANRKRNPLPRARV